MSIFSYFLHARSRSKSRVPNPLIALFSIGLQLSFAILPVTPQRVEAATPLDVMDAAKTTMDNNMKQSVSNENMVVLALNLADRASLMAKRFTDQSTVYSTALGDINGNIAKNVTAMGTAAVGTAGLSAAQSAILTHNNESATIWATTIGALASQCTTLSGDLTTLSAQLRDSAGAVTNAINELKVVAKTCDTGTEIAAGVSTVVALGVASQTSGNPYAKGSSASGTTMGVGIAGGVGAALINTQLDTTQQAASTSNSTATVAAAGICGSFIVDGYEGVSYFNTAKTVSQNLKTDQALLSSLQSSSGGAPGYDATMATGLPSTTDAPPGAISVTQQGQIQKAVSTLKYVEPITYVEAGGYTGLAAYCGFQCLSLYGNAMDDLQSALNKQYKALRDLMTVATTTLPNYNILLNTPPSPNVPTLGCPLVDKGIFTAPITAILVPAPLPPATPLAPAADVVAQAGTQAGSVAANATKPGDKPATTTPPAVPPPPPTAVAAVAAVDPNCEFQHQVWCTQLTERLKIGKVCSQKTLDGWGMTYCGTQMPCTAGGSNSNVAIPSSFPPSPECNAPPKSATVQGATTGTS